MLFMLGGLIEKFDEILEEILLRLRLGYFILDNDESNPALLFKDDSIWLFVLILGVTLLSSVMFG